MITATPTVASTPHLGPGIPFTRSLRVEWRKSIDTRAARWLLASVVAVSVIAAVVPIATPHSSAQDLSNYLAIMAIGVTLLLPVVSILTLTSEWSQRTVLSTFTQDPRRDRVLAAKLTVGLALAAIGGLAGLVIASAGLQVSDALGRTVSWNIDPSGLVGYALFVVLSSLMGMAFGALLHNTAAAIAAYFALPTLVTLVAVPLAPIRDWVDTATTSGWILHGEWSGHTAQIVTSIGIWVLLPLLVGLSRAMRRDAN
jgi:ABC-2 type transport system permease protein